MKNRIETLVSVVLTLGDTKAATLEDYLNKLQHHLSLYYSDYEIVVIDQNINNQINPLERENILKNISSIRWIKMAFPIEADRLPNIGIENAIGDYVVFLRPSVDPIHLVHNMVEQSSHGYNIVIGVADYPKTLLYKMVRKLSP